MEIQEIATLYDPISDRDAAYSYLDKEGVLSYLPKSSEEDRIPPDYCDLARLHSLIRSRKVFTVLEFGLGFSTIVMAAALKQNKLEWEALPNPPRVRNSNMFELHSVDSSRKWLEGTRKLVPGALGEIINLHYSDVHNGTFQDRLCHYYSSLPNVIADFIYLDGPDPVTAQGHLNGLSFQNKDRVVMAADLLRMETGLLPGTCIVSDGRAANARFLREHFYRNWAMVSSQSPDIHVLELQEAPLGAINRETLVYCLGSRIEDWPN